MLILVDTAVEEEANGVRTMQDDHNANCAGVVFGATLNSRMPRVTSYDSRAGYQRLLRKVIGGWRICGRRYSPPAVTGFHTSYDTQDIPYNTPVCKCHVAQRLDKGT